MNIPDGWQLVPKDPTPEMLSASKRSTGGAKSVEACDRAIYAAMLGAAPAPPVTEEVHMIGDYRADYSGLTEEEIALAQPPEVEDLMRNSIPVNRRLPSRT